MDPISGFFEPGQFVPEADTFECIYRSGGWCEIWRGIRDGQWRVFKCLKEQYRSNFLYQELLRKEFEICRNLNHPGIRRSFSLTELKDLGYCIEMEYVEGENLSNLLDSGQLSPEMAQTITEELLDAVEYLHRNQIAHGDLKPSNIMVSRDGGHVKLIDFGLADTDSWAILKMKGGTPTYAAPELKHSKGGSGGQVSDMYSLGVILGKLGTVPNRVVRHCCAAKPQSRWKSVAQIRTALERRKKRAPWQIFAVAALVFIPLLWWHGPVITFISSLFPVKNAPWGGLCIEAIEDGKVSFENQSHGPVEYSFDTRRWIKADTLVTIDLHRRECVYFRGTNTSYSQRNMEKSRYSHFKFSNLCYAYGNMMSLIDSVGFEKANSFVRSHNFARIFEDNPTLRSHPKKKLILPATTLTVGCYRWMFKGCTGITEAPELPATMLKGYCYQQMFDGCTSLEKAPELPATKVSAFCYASMFESCTNLRQGPEILPATDLDICCYMMMFAHTALQKAPVLPATQLAEKCYAYMFSYCPDLERGPVLPAATLEEKCYMGMFQSDSRLSYVEVHASDISAQDCTTNWMLDTPARGTFVCRTDSLWVSNRSHHGVPKGWEIKEMEQ